MDKVMVDNYMAKYCVKKLSLSHSHVYRLYWMHQTTKAFLIALLSYMLYSVYRMII